MVPEVLDSLPGLVVVLCECMLGAACGASDCIEEDNACEIQDMYANTSTHFKRGREGGSEE